MRPAPSSGFRWIWCSPSESTSKSGLLDTKRDIIQIEKGKEIKKMYEYEILYKGTNEHDILYGYSLRDLARRYPEIDPNSYMVLMRTYID